MTIIHHAFNIVSQILLYLVLAFIILGLIFHIFTCLLDKIFGEKW
jgi:hypothetical protein